MSYVRILSIALLALIVGCAPQSSGKGDKSARSTGLNYEVTRAFKPGSISRVIVYPAAAAEGVEIPISVTSKVTSKLISQLSNISAYSVANLDRPGWQAAAAEIAKNPAPIAKNALQFASKYDAQAVIYAEVYRYVETNGSSLGADDPASVGVRVWMVNATTGQLLWRGIFDETERPLSANILDFGDKVRSGFAYRSADQIMDGGMKEVAQVLEKFRVAPKS